MLTTHNAANHLCGDIKAPTKPINFALQGQQCSAHPAQISPDFDTCDCAKIVSLASWTSKPVYIWGYALGKQVQPMIGGMHPIFQHRLLNLQDPHKLLSSASATGSKYDC